VVGKDVVMVTGKTGKSVLATNFPFYSLPHELTIIPFCASCFQP